MADKTGPGKASSGARLAIGQRVSHYEILEEIGESDSGEIYLAHDTKLDRRVAFKCLSSEVESDANARNRFLQEAQEAASLHHPYIRNVHEVGEEGSRAYIAMELTHGETLVERLACGPIAPAEVLRITSEIAEALEAAHAEGVVHGSLNLGSIMLTEAGHVKVTDFEQDEPAPAYLSPEQVRGEVANASSDIFSLGVVLYEMLTGVHPFRKESPRDTASAISNLEPAPVSRYTSEAPELLEHIVRKMLAKAPAERYQLVHEVRTDLELAREDDLADAERVGVAGTRRLLRPLVWAGVFAVALVSVLTWWMLSEPDPTGPPSMAVLPLRNVSADPSESDYLAAGISRAVITKLTQAGLRVTPWETAQRYAQSNDPPEAIARELNADAVLVGTFELVGDRIRTTLSLVDAKSGFQSWADEFEEPYEDLFGLQRRIAVGAATSLKRQLTGEEEEALTSPESRSVDAYDYYLQGSHMMEEGTQEAMDIALQYFNRAIEIDPSYADAHVGVGAVYTERYYSGWEGGLRNLGLAERSFEKALSFDPESMIARRGLMLLNLYDGRSEACLAQGKEAARLGRHFDVDTLLARAHAYSYGGMNDRSLPLLRQILEIDPVNQGAQWHLVLASFWAGEFEQAIAAGDVYSRRFGDDQLVHTKVGHSYFVLGDYERAQEHYEKATSSENPQYHDAFVFAGILYERMGDRDGAEAVWRRGIELVAPRLEAYPDNVRMRLLLAIFENLLGRKEAFAAELERLLEEPGINAFELYYLAAAHFALGETEEGVEVLRRTLRLGRVSSSWKQYLKMASPSPPTSEAYSEFLEEFETRYRRLRETY